MSYWNHRVVKRTYGDGKVTFGIHEVFYNKDDSIYAYTKDPVEVSCESIEALREYLQWMMDCLDKDVLVDGEVEFSDPNGVNNGVETD